MSLWSIEDIGPATEEKIEAAGITTVEQLADADVDTLAEQTGVAEGRLQASIDRARTAIEASPHVNENPKLLSGGNPQIQKAGRPRSGGGLGRRHAGLEARRRVSPRRTH